MSTDRRVEKLRKQARGRSSERLRNLGNLTNAEYAKILRDKAYADMLATSRKG